jgi:type IV pilus assembly protein PilN
VILINLLPHREAARKQRRDRFNITLVLAALAGVVISGAVFLWFEAQISVQKGKNQLLSKEIKVLEGQIRDIAGLETEIAALRARQQAVEDLQADRNQPVHLLTELVKQLPDGVYISSMRQDSQNVTLQGVAQSNERVSELLRNLANNSPWFSKPELVEIVSGTIAVSPREQKRISNFSIRVKLLRASEIQKAPQPALSVSAAGLAAVVASAPSSVTASK